MIYALALYAILNILDGWSTRRFLAEGRREGNPIARWMMERIGTVPAIVLFKLASVAIVAGLAWWSGPYWPMVMIFPTGLTLYTVLDNLELV